MPQEAITVSVTIMANPKADVQWYQNDTLVVEDARHHLTNDGCKYSLTVNPVLSFDAGSVTCQASNSQGTATCSARLKMGGAMRDLSEMCIVNHV